MSCLMVKLISRTVPKLLPRYECKREIKFLSNIFKKSSTVRMKYIKSGALLCSCLPFIYLYNKGELNIALLTGYVLVVFLYVVWIIYLAHTGKNLIGKIYLHKDKKDMLVSYVNVNGTRSDKIFNIDDVEVIDHQSILMKKFFKKVVFHNSPQEFNLCTYKTIKVNPAIYHTVFPEL